MTDFIHDGTPAAKATLLLAHGAGAPMDSKATVTRRESDEMRGRSPGSSEGSARDREVDDEEQQGAVKHNGRCEEEDSNRCCGGRSDWRHAVRSAQGQPEI